MTPPAKVFFSLLFAFTAAGIRANTVTAPDTRRAPVDSARIELLATDNSGVTFDFFAGAVQTTAASGVIMPGAEKLSLPGEPDLPGKMVLVGIPQQGEVSLDFSALKTEELSGITVAPATGLTEAPVLPAAMFEKDEFWPGKPAEIIEITTLRNCRIARVRINPVQFNPVKKVLRVHTHLRCVLKFSLPPENRQKPDAFDPLLQNILLNGATAINWKIAGPEKDSINFFSRFGQWCRIKTDSTGIYKITPAQLKGAGFSPEGIDPRTIRLFTIGRYRLNGPYPDTMVEVPIYVQGEADGKLDNQDYILFYALAPSCWDESLATYQTNYHTNYRTYWLTWGADAGKRLNAVSGAGATAPVAQAGNVIRLEEDNLCPARSGLLWLWQRYTNTGTSPASFYQELALPNRERIDRLTIRLYAATDRIAATYRAVLSLNGFLLDTVTLEARSQATPPNTFTFDSLPGEWTARPGKSDSLGITLLSASDVYLDYIEVLYQEELKISRNQPRLEFFTTAPVDLTIKGAGSDFWLLDVTDPFNPRRVTDYRLTDADIAFRWSQPGLTRFFATRPEGFRTPVAVEKRQPGNLRSPLVSADYYVICPDEFIVPARLLARYRENNIPGITGARAQAVPLSQIYDDYAFGMEEPGAIKAFLSAKRPVFGLLAGDATYDYKDNLRLGKKPSVPAYEIGFDLDYEVYNPYVKALDAWFADFDGEGSSPDMILARITARTAQELRNFLEKVKNYETQQPGIWAKRFLILGDDEYLGDPAKKESFIHIHGCEGVAPLAGKTLDVVKVYLTEYPLEGIRSKPKAQAELLRQLNQGALLWCFFGHGAGFQLCHERAFNIEDVPLVRNGGRTPFAFFGSCGVGRFEDTKYEAIAEELVRSPAGCIATLGATKATYSSSNEAFAQSLFSRLLNNPDQPIGVAFYEPWARTSNLYILFGDPATLLRLPRRDSAVAVMPDTFYPGGAVAWSINSPLNSGFFEIVAKEAERVRFYSSDIGTITYTLPGEVIFRTTGKFTASTAQGNFIVPRIAFPDTIIVGNGYYTRSRENCYVSALLWAPDQPHPAKSHLSAPVFLSPDSMPRTDTTPPQFTLRADNITLKPGDTTPVPKNFTLSARLADPAGILLYPDPSYGLSLYLGDPSTRISLADRFIYDDNSATTGRVACPIELQKTADSLIFIASDNNLNRRIGKFYLKTDLRGKLQIDSALVYPNPVKNSAFFTFRLSQPARVTVKIYTIAGKLLAVLGPYNCPFGYNQIPWDVRNKDGTPLPNGVYLYKLDATAPSPPASASYRDRFIINR